MSSFLDVKAAPLEVGTFLAQELAELLTQPFFADLIAGTFEPARGAIVRERINAIAGHGTG